VASPIRYRFGFDFLGFRVVVVVGTLQIVVVVVGRGLVVVVVATAVVVVPASEVDVVATVVVVVVVVVVLAEVVVVVGLQFFGGFGFDLGFVVVVTGFFTGLCTTFRWGRTVLTLSDTSACQATLVPGAGDW
jgi:hypothetical protein